MCEAKAGLHVVPEALHLCLVFNLANGDSLSHRSSSAAQKLVLHAGAAEGLAAIFGLHIWPFLPTGTLASRPGPIMAAALQFEARITGRGGHAGIPPRFIDPILPAAAIVGALQVLHMLRSYLPL